MDTYANGEKMLPFPKGTPLAIECERIYCFGPNLILAATADSICHELAEMTEIKTIRQLTKEKPEIASLLRAISLIQEEKKISC